MGRFSAVLMADDPDELPRKRNLARLLSTLLRLEDAGNMLQQANDGQHALILENFRFLVSIGNVNFMIKTRSILLKKNKERKVS